MESCGFSWFVDEFSSKVQFKQQGLLGGPRCQSRDTAPLRATVYPFRFFLRYPSGEPPLGGDIGLIRRIQAKKRVENAR